MGFNVCNVFVVIEFSGWHCVHQKSPDEPPSDLAVAPLPRTGGPEGCSQRDHAGDFWGCGTGG